MGFCFMREGQHGVGCESERVPVFGWRKIMRGDQIKFEKGLSEDASKISFVTDFLLPEASSVEIVPLGSRISQVKGGMCRA